jgi:hypothetical protein
MDKVSRLVGVLVCAAMVASAGCSTSNSALTPATGSTTTLQAPAAGQMGSGWIHAGGVVYHAPHYMAIRGKQPAVQPAIQLTYGGGPVLTTPKIYLIFWDFKVAGDPNHLKKLLKLYAKNVGGSGYNNIYTQYTGPSGNIQNPANQFGGAWADNGHSIPSAPSDSQVAAEAVNGMTHFGFDANGSYVVVTAHNHNSPGFGTQFCAYHSDTSTNKGIISYTNLPYIPDAGQNCGAGFISPPSDETSADEGVTIVEGHEYGESVTDPQPFSGWNSAQGEIGDLCAWTNIQNDPYGSKSYTAQPMFSNASSSCVHSF